MPVNLYNHNSCCTQSESLSVGVESERVPLYTMRVLQPGLATHSTLGEYRQLTGFAHNFPHVADRNKHFVHCVKYII